MEKYYQLSRNHQQQDPAKPVHDFGVGQPEEGHPNQQVKKNVPHRMHQKWFAEQESEVEY